jgi:thiamine-phosphate pyrophosphorylase
LAKQQLAYLPQPLELATEHLLLGLTAAEHEVAAWLRERGFAPDALAAEIHAMHRDTESASGIDEDTPPSAKDQAETSPIDEPLDDSTPTEVGESFHTDAQRSSQTAASNGAQENVVPAPDLPCRTDKDVQLTPEACDGRRVDAADVGVLRILDAAANRAREGLRVVEDYTRFVLDDRRLTGLCKQLRHELTAALARLPERRRLTARDTQADIGTSLTTDSELRREDIGSVLAANFGRLQESLRSLEEFGKIVDVEMAAAFKQLRYRVYTIHRAVEITRGSLFRLDDCHLYVLLDGRDSTEEFARLANLLITAGADVIQFRDKQLDDRLLLERARLLRSLTACSRTLMVVNDRPDLAVLAKADGVHVGQDELSVKDARAIVGPDMLIGVSTHSIEQARRAVLDGADYLGVGPTFPSETKQFSHFPGIELLRAVAAEIRLPAFAIGGIGLDNVYEVTAAGFTRIAVSGAVTSASDPGEAARKLRAAIRY